MNLKTYLNIVYISIFFLCRYFYCKTNGCSASAIFDGDNVRLASTVHSCTIEASYIESLRVLNRFYPLATETNEPIPKIVNRIVSSVGMSVASHLPSRTALKMQLYRLRKRSIPRCQHHLNLIFQIAFV